MIIKKEQRIASAGDSKKAGAPDFKKLEIASIAQLAGSGRLLSEIILPVGAQVPEHEHINEFEVYFILSGEGDYNDNGTTIRVKAGDVTYCPHGERHGLVNNGPDEIAFVAFIGYPNPERQ